MHVTAAMSIAVSWVCSKTSSVLRGMSSVSSPDKYRSPERESTGAEKPQWNAPMKELRLGTLQNIKPLKMRQFACRWLSSSSSSSLIFIFQSY